MRLDGSEAIFEITETDPLTRTTYIGEFRVRCFLTPLEAIKADRIYRELIGPVNPILASESAKNLSFALAQLNVRTVTSPDFFKNEKNPELPGGHLPDSVLISILDKAIDAEQKFRKQQAKKFKETQKRLTEKFQKNIIQKKVEEDEEIPKLDDDQDSEAEEDGSST